MQLCLPMDFPDPSGRTESIIDGTLSAPGNIMLLGIATSGPATFKKKYVHLVSDGKKKTQHTTSKGRKEGFIYSTYSVNNETQ